MDRIKSYPLWIAVAALVGMILSDAFGITPDAYQPYVDAILAVLIAAGVVNNPSSGSGFKDK